MWSVCGDLCNAPVGASAGRSLREAGRPISWSHFGFRQRGARVGATVYRCTNWRRLSATWCCCGLSGARLVPLGALPGLVAAGLAALPSHLWLPPFGIVYFRFAPARLLLVQSPMDSSIAALELRSPTLEHVDRHLRVVGPCSPPHREPATAIAHWQGPRWCRMVYAISPRKRRMSSALAEVELARRSMRSSSGRARAHESQHVGSAWAGEGARKAGPRRVGHHPCCRVHKAIAPPLGLAARQCLTRSLASRPRRSCGSAPAKKQCQTRVGAARQFSQQRRPDA